LELSVGCTGWGYDGWVGPFYPKSLPNSKFLNHYSGIFDITEVNSTFYAIPKLQIVKKWYSDTPPQFKFTAKMPKIITHENRLQKLEPYLEQFLESMKPLGSKFLLSVVQLPPSLSFEDAKPNLEHLESFFKNSSYVIEGRHQSWFSENALRYLTDKKICLVWSDVQGIKNTAPLTSDLVYLRVIGDRSIPQKEFGKVLQDRTTDLKEWAEKINQLKDKITFAVIMANNRYEGFGPATANKLRLLLGLDAVAFSDTRQKTLENYK
jgi:uncharacterized protein YecE (DUF72 family)